MSTARKKSVESDDTKKNPAKTTKIGVWQTEYKKGRPSHLHQNTCWWKTQIILAKGKTSNLKRPRLRHPRLVAKLENLVLENGETGWLRVYEQNLRFCGKFGHYFGTNWKIAFDLSENIFEKEGKQSKIRKKEHLKPHKTKGSWTSENNYFRTKIGKTGKMVIFKPNLKQKSEKPVTSEKIAKLGNRPSVAKCSIIAFLPEIWSFFE